MPKVKTWEEYKTECEAVAKPGITILGWVGEWKGSYTRLKCDCNQHGPWQTTTIRNFKTGASCPMCWQNRRYKNNLMSDDKHVAEIEATGKFKEGTVFKRNTERKNTCGARVYWNYICPICSNDEYVKAGLCSGVFTALLSSLKRGVLSCRCSSIPQYTKRQWEYRLTKMCKERGYLFSGWVGTEFGYRGKFSYDCPIHGEQKMLVKQILSGQGCAACAGQNQQQCYINVVCDQKVPLALKLGIAKDANIRLQWLNRCNLFQMVQVVVYYFPSVEDCKNAERTCLSELRCGVLSERELKDGWTETVALTDYDKVVSIYERFGGILISEKQEEECCEF